MPSLIRETSSANLLTTDISHHSKYDNKRNSNVKANSNRCCDATSTERRCMKLRLLPTDQNANLCLISDALSLICLIIYLIDVHNFRIQ